MLRAVFDANVFVSAFIAPGGTPGQLVTRFLADRAFEIVLSPPIADEVLRALAYPKVRKHARSGVGPELWFEDIALLALLVAGEEPFPRVSGDPDDDKYLAAAIEGRAVFVVSGDPALLSLKQYDSVRIVTPRAFLDVLGVC